MATFHYSTSVLRRSKGRKALDHTAYRRATRQTDARNGRTYDYTTKPGVVHSEILLPAGAPGWMQDPGKLWQAVEHREKRHDAQLARVLEIALPRELPPAERLNLIRDFLGEQFVAHGMVADLSLHEVPASDGGLQPHAHVALTMRRLLPEPRPGAGAFGNKVRTWNEWNLVPQQRARWADMVNERLAAGGHEARVDHRSYVARGMDIVPQRKLGPSAARRVGRGTTAPRAETHHAIRSLNDTRMQNRPSMLLKVVAGEKLTFTQTDLAAVAARYTVDVEHRDLLVARVLVLPELELGGTQLEGHQRYRVRQHPALPMFSIARRAVPECCLAPATLRDGIGLVLRKPRRTMMPVGKHGLLRPAPACLVLDATELARAEALLRHGEAAPAVVAMLGHREARQAAVHQERVLWRDALVRAQAPKRSMWSGTSLSPAPVSHAEKADASPAIVHPASVASPSGDASAMVLLEKQLRLRVSTYARAWWRLQEADPSMRANLDRALSDEAERLDTLELGLATTLRALLGDEPELASKLKGEGRCHRLMMRLAQAYDQKATGTTTCLPSPESSDQLSPAKTPAPPPIEVPAKLRPLDTLPPLNKTFEMRKAVQMLPSQPARLKPAVPAPEPPSWVGKITSVAGRMMTGFMRGIGIGPKQLAGSTTPSAVGNHRRGSAIAPESRRTSHLPPAPQPSSVAAARARQAAPPSSGKDVSRQGAAVVPVNAVRASNGRRPELEGGTRLPLASCIPLPEARATDRASRSATPVRPRPSPTRPAP